MLATIECPKGTNVRFELAAHSFSPVFKTKRPWVENYGFVNKTLQADGDSLDCYILSKKRLKVGQVVEVHAIAAIICFDDGQRDDKFICITPDHRPSKRRVEKTIRKLVRTIRKSKKETVVLGVRYSASWLYYELVKYRAYDKLFSKGR